MPQNLKVFLARWLINTAAVIVASSLVSGIRYDNWTGLMVATLVLGILNTFVRPVLMLLSLPLLLFTVGIFYFVICGLLLYWVGHLVTGFHVDSFKAAFWGAVVIWLVTMFLNTLTGMGNSRVVVRRGGPPPPNRNDDGGGPVIDI